ncbi:MAG: hypothetical protein K8Q91_01050 [Candidatus Vogelbacteria bacterium]|nr:hypothetical protein [Candidatus Vogelbacteria bacterium]
MVIIENLKSQILNPLIGFLFVLATLYFVWGVFQFIQNADSDTGRQQGRDSILWGLFGMFIMVAVFGIMWTICNTVQCQ